MQYSFIACTFLLCTRLYSKADRNFRHASIGAKPDSATAVLQPKCFFATIAQPYYTVLVVYWYTKTPYYYKTKTLIIIYCFFQLCI